MALCPSKSTFSTNASVRTVRFARPLAGFKYAYEVLWRAPLSWVT